VRNTAVAAASGFCHAGSIRSLHTMNLYLPKHPVATRRETLRRLAGGSLLFAAPGAFAEALTRTPAQTEGPFYPDHLPLDTDNDLLIVNAGITPAVGTVAYVSGRVLDANGNPLRNATVEIWQCDNHGAYIHSGSDNAAKRDKHFQGFGRFLTGVTGEYLFRTIKPVSYPGRTPHIHFKIKHGGKDVLTTQLYVAGEKEKNEADGLWKRIADEKARANCTVDFAPMAGSKAGELAAKFEIVLGITPAE
jgi:protocatechuate 3,4-dioxygenase, beta subunit